MISFSIHSFSFPGSFWWLFQLFISVYMGPTTIPSQSSETIKIPTAQYEFGANFLDPKVGCNYDICFPRFMFIIVTLSSNLIT